MQALLDGELNAKAWAIKNAMEKQKVPSSPSKSKSSRKSSNVSRRIATKKVPETNETLSVAPILEIETFTLGANTLSNNLAGEINTRLERELQEIESNPDANVDEVSLSRLQAYRNAFNRIIEEFQIFRPLLFDIKSCYEDTFEKLLLKLQELSKIRVENAVQSEQGRLQYIKELKASYELKLANIADDKRAADEYIIKKEKEIFLLKEELTTRREETEKYRKETEEMLASCQRLTSALTRLDAEKKILQNKEFTRTQDQLAMKISERKAIDEAEKTRRLLQQLEAHQSSLVSQDVVLKQRSTIDQLESDLRMLSDNHKRLIERYTVLKSTIEDSSTTLSSELAAKARDLSSLENGSDLSTRMVIEGLINKIEELNIKIQDTEIKVGFEFHSRTDSLAVPSSTRSLETDGESWGFNESSSSSKAMKDSSLPKSSHEDVETSIETSWRYLPTLGETDDVPCYLRYHGCVQNLFLTKDELVVIIKEIWKERVHYLKTLSVAMDQEEGFTLAPYLTQAKPFSEFFLSFLKEKYKQRSKAMEISYNIMNALDKYSNFSDAKLFLLILKGDISEECFYDVMKVADRLRNLMRKEEIEPNFIAVENCSRILRSNFSYKSDSAISKLNKALLIEGYGSRYIDYNRVLYDSCWSLFHEDTQKSGSASGPKSFLQQNRVLERSIFLELFRLQYISEYTSYEKHVMEMINKLHGPNNSIGETTISKIREAILVAEPNKGRTEVNILLANGCSSSVHDMLLLDAQNAMININDFQKKMRKFLIKRSPPEKKSSLN